MSNEITVKIECSINELYKMLESKGFSIVDKYRLDDIYYIKNTIEVNKDSIKEILSNCILLRNITQYKPNDFFDSYKIIKITLKQKEINSKGEIIKQTKNDCEISDIQQGKNFIIALGYKELVEIKENSIVYGKDGLNIAVKDIDGEEPLIEIETDKNNSELNTIDKIKQKIEELNIPIDRSNYFVKKVELKLEKLL